MATKTTIKSSVVKPAAPAQTKDAPASSKPEVRTSRTSRTSRTDENMHAPRPKRTCLFCDNKSQPSFTDSVTLKKFMNDRSKIVAHTRTGLCSKHQRHTATQIKYARHLALLPFTARV